MLKFVGDKIWIVFFSALIVICFTLYPWWLLFISSFIFLVFFQKGYDEKQLNIFFVYLLVVNILLSVFFVVASKIELWYVQGMISVDLFDYSKDCIHFIERHPERLFLPLSCSIYLLSKRNSLAILFFISVLSKDFLFLSIVASLGSLFVFRRKVLFVALVAYAFVDFFAKHYFLLIPWPLQQLDIVMYTIFLIISYMKISKKKA